MIPARTRLRALALALATVTILTACSGGADEQTRVATPTATTGGAPSSASRTTGEVQRVRLSTRIDHAHGLVASGDRTLLVGTHSGIVQVGVDGRTEPVGQGEDDLMGMTGVPGTPRLISSGHPGRSSTMPNPLGLMSSDDGGISWTPLSLAGQVDFHALATDGQMIAGFDGQRGIRISADGGRTWTAGAPIAAAALAMTPGTLWASTEEGLQRSTDAGRTFTVVPGAPRLWLLARGADSSLWGVDVDGYAWRSVDGAEWERRAAVGQVDAIAVLDHATAYAVTAEELHILT